MSEFDERVRRLQAEADESKERWREHISDEMAGEDFTIKFKRSPDIEVPMSEYGLHDEGSWPELTVAERIKLGSELPEEKVIWVGQKESWETQWKFAVDLLRQGYSVWLHDHTPDDRCRKDGAHCRCGHLTLSDDTPTLDLVTPTDSR
jgi:hypothetical protein